MIVNGLFPTWTCLIVKFVEFIFDSMKPKPNYSHIDNNNSILDLRLFEALLNGHTGEQNVERYDPELNKNANVL
jgi:hypothetical protein